MSDFDYDPAKVDEMVPAHLRDGLRRYVEQGIKPGDALSAVLRNDLAAAVLRGDENTIAGMRPTILFLTNYAPSLCWGDVRKFEAWIACRGLEGATLKRPAAPADEQPPFVLLHPGTGQYVSPDGWPHSYCHFHEAAQFESRAIAEQHACGDEIAVSIHKKGTHP